MCTNDVIVKNEIESALEFLHRSPVALNLQWMDAHRFLCLTLGASVSKITYYFPHSLRLTRRCPAQSIIY
jgi:hypothetical protein